MQRPCGLQIWLPGQGRNVPHSAHTWVVWLHAWAVPRPVPQFEQSLSTVHVDGHRCAHVPALHAWFGRQMLVFVALHETHACVVASHAWCWLSHAAQSTSALQVISGLPLLSYGHVVPAATHTPNCVHS